MVGVRKEGRREKKPKQAKTIQAVEAVSYAVTETTAAAAAAGWQLENSRKTAASTTARTGFSTAPLPGLLLLSLLLYRSLLLPPLNLHKVMAASCG